MNKPKNMRYALYAKAHVLAQQLGFDDDTYRTVLMTQTGKTSCKDLADKQLSSFVETLERFTGKKASPAPRNAPEASAKRLAGQVLPTAAQWKTLEGISARLGWHGLDDFRLLSFALRTAKVSDLNELSRAAMSKLITGLLRMTAQRKETDAAKGVL